MAAIALFDEHSLTVVAAVFPNPRAAQQAAEQLRRQMPPAAGDVTVLRPGDANVAARVDPDTSDSWHSVIRSHLILGVIGMALGLLVAGVLLKTQWPSAASSPGLLSLFMAVVGALTGLLMGSLLTMRLSHGRVLRHVQQALTEGRTAVVTHPCDETMAGTATVALRRAGGTVIRSS